MSVSSKILVRFTRPFDNGGSTVGYILDRGPQFFLLALVGDNLRFNGFNCIRYRDVRGLEVPARYAAFAESALKLRSERIPGRPRVKLSTTSELLATAGRAFPIITIHRENVDPDVCQIGRVVAVDTDKVGLLEINPDARWDSRPHVYRTREITRIDFGGSYEDALTLVGGLPPENGLPK
jgi:hypothetical protein